MIEKRFEVPIEFLANKLADEGYFDNTFGVRTKSLRNTFGIRHKPLRHSFYKPLDGIKYFTDENVAVAITANDDGIALIDVYKYEGDDARHIRIGRVRNYKKYIKEIEYLWVKHLKKN